MDMKDPSLLKKNVGFLLDYETDAFMFDIQYNVLLSLNKTMCSSSTD